jgi:iron complex transport system permease protein
LLLPLLAAALLTAVVLSLGLGHYPVPAGKIIDFLLSFESGESHDPEDFPWIVIMMIRLPRVIMAVLAGMSLGLAGAAMQGVFRNPLVGPEVVGVSAGAAFGGVLAIFLGLNSFGGLLALSFFFATGALALAFLFSRLAGRSGLLGFILAGVIISGFFGAMVGLAQYVAEPNVQLLSIIFWLMGSFSAATFEKTAFLAAVFLAAGLPLLGLSWRINLLSLGADDARSLGFNLNRMRWVIVALVSLMVAAQVSVSGGVGWVGLIIPHLARMLVGPEHSRLLPVSGLLGGLYLLMMDDLARTVSRQEIPIGLLTSVVGAPVFFAVFWKLQNRGWADD